MDSNQPNLPTEPQQPVVTPAPVGAQPNVPIAYAAPPQPPRRPKKGIIIGSIIAGTLVILGGGGALAYNLWYQNPEKVLFDALTHAFKSESVTGAGVVTLKTNDVNMKITFGMAGKDKDGRVDAKVNIDGTSDGEMISVDVTATLLAKGDTFYFKLDNLQKTVDKLAESYGEIPDYVDTIVKKVDGQWVSVKSSDYEDVSKEVAKQQKCTTELVSNLSDNGDMKNELIDLYKENKILVIDEQLSAKDVGGVGSLGYEISADTEAAKNFIKGLSDTEFGKELKKCDDSVDFDEAADAIEEATKDDNSGTTIKFELWASRFGHQITEVKTTIKDDEASGSIVFNPMFNQDVTIEAPSQAITMKQLQKDIENAMQEYYSSLFNQVPYNPSDEYNYEEQVNRTYNLN